MTLFQKMLTRINGLHYSQDYLCLEKESFQQPLYSYAVEQGKVVYNLTSHHIFAGYSPLVFAIPAAVFAGHPPISLQVMFTLRSLKQNDFLPQKDALAALTLEKTDAKGIDPKIVLLYEGVEGQHRFLSWFHQTIGRLNNRWFGKKPGNVYLRGNLYQQVQIAYAVPRRVCLISVGDNQGYNLFPTDLHGPVNDEFYLISLRHQGRACSQVATTEKIVLSDMDPQAYKQVYGLGKNHMQPLKERASFRFTAQESRVFRLPLPLDVVAYRELHVIGSVDKGIHRLMLCRTVSYEKTVQRPSTLAHIHSCFATWRWREGIKSNYLMR